MQSSPPRLRYTSCVTCQNRMGHIFCNLSTEALREFDRLGTQLRLPAAARLFEEDEIADSIYVLCNGLVKLFCTSKEGRTLILKLARSGEVLGLSAVVSRTRFEVTAETLQSSIVRKIRAGDFQHFLQEHAEAGMHAAQSLSEDYKAVFVDARRLALSGSAAGRLAGILLEWGRTTAHNGTLMAFKMALTHEELAGIAGTSRETVTRTLGAFQREKIIAIKGASFHILLPEKLAELAA